MIDNSENKRGKKLDSISRLLFQVIGLFLMLYGFLALTQPENYGVGIPTIYTPLLGMGLIFGGFYIFWRYRRFE